MGEARHKPSHIEGVQLALRLYSCDVEPLLPDLAKEIHLLLPKISFGRETASRAV